MRVKAAANGCASSMRHPAPTKPHWLSPAHPDQLKRPGHLTVWLARRLLSRSAMPRTVCSRAEGYFEWEASTAEGAWDYWSRFLPRNSGNPGLVLDVASGLAGRTASYAQVASQTFVCLDRVEEQHKVGRRHVAKLGLENLRFVGGDAYRLPFPDDSIDVCLSENALEHFDRPDVAISEMYRVLKPDGVLLALFPVWQGPFAGHLRTLTWLPWVHLLPSAYFVRLLSALLIAHDGEANWRSATIIEARNLVEQLNGWTVEEVLRAFARHDIGLKAAYVLGEWWCGRLLRFLPFIGPYFSSAVYLVFGKRAGESWKPTLDELRRRTWSSGRVQERGSRSSARKLEALERRCQESAFRIGP